MNSLMDIYSKIELDNRIISILRDETTPPYTYNLNPVKQFTYPFPPFLIPIFVDADIPLYLGVVYYPFSERNMVFVEYDLSAGYMWEIARNSKQLFTSFLIDSILSNDDEIDSEIRDFAIKLNVDIDDNFVKTYKNIFDGDSFRTYMYFDAFAEETPAAYAKDMNTYNGEFPSVKSELNIQLVNNASELEIHESVDLSKTQELPIWFKQNKLETFNQFINKGDLNSAWLTLNSKGWKLEDIYYGLEQLKSKSDNDLFHIIADNWIKGWQESNTPKDQMMY